MTDWTAERARLHQTLRSRGLLPRGSRLLLAVSGGQDSIALSRLLVDLQHLWAWDLAIAHCDHQWRPDSAANAAFVADWARSLGLPFYLDRWSSGPGQRSEAAARAWRYGVLADRARALGCGSIVTAHTASDRAETLLLNLGRGSGRAGLAALTWERSLRDTGEIRLVRPLLDWTRAEITAFVAAAGLPVWHDTSNDDLRYRRNAVRQVVLPILRDRLNPAIDRHLAQTAEVLADEDDYLDQVAQTWLARSILTAAPSPAQLDRTIIRQAPIALQRRVLRAWFGVAAIAVQPADSAEAHPQHTLSFEQTEKLRRLLTAPSRSQTDPFPGGAIVRAEAKTLVFLPSVSTSLS